MQDWESMIAERMEAHGTVVTCRVQDPRRRNRQAYDRRHDKTPERREQHKAWAKTPAGKKSMRERGARYRATEKGRLNSLKKSRHTPNTVKNLECSITDFFATMSGNR